MSQHDLVIDNQNGAAVRADINVALQAIGSNQSGATEPPTNYAYQWWADTANGLLKQRNAADNAWIVRGTLAETQTVARSSNTIIGIADRAKVFVCTSTFTQTFTAAATLADGFYCFFRNNGAGVITFDPNSTEVIDTATTVALNPGESCMVWTDGTAFYTVGRRGFTLDTDTALTANSDLAVATQKATKAYVDAAGGAKVPVRQTVLSAAISAGVASFISAGSGLAVDLDGTPTPVTLAFAAGFGSGGAVDYVGQVSTDEASYWSSLAASTVTFLAIARNSGSGAITSYKTIVPPQYGYAFDKSAQELLRFAGADASTTILSDYGNTWTAVGNAQIDTAVTINGLNTLLLDGTGDYIANTGMTSLGSGSWTVEFKHRRAAAGTAQRMLTFTNASAFGLKLHWATNNKIELYLSSNGSSDDIANGTQTTNAFSSTATDYHIAVTFDQVAGKYYVYVDGVKETEVSSTTLVHAAHTLWRIGADHSGTNGLNGTVAGFRFSPCCRYSAGTTFTPPDISTFAVEGHYFSIPNMTMYEVTTASASAGTDPTMTAVQRVFVGEATAGAASISSVVNYALRGQFRSALTTALPALGTNVSANHNIGATPIRADLYVQNRLAEQGFSPGDTNVGLMASNGAFNYPVGLYLSRRTVQFTAGGSGHAIVHKTNGTAVQPTIANWGYFFDVERGW